MAQAVTIRHGDTITGILQARKGVQGHDIFAWKRKLERLNPHIGNLDRIFPGESILIPDSLNEPIAGDRIWRNAFCKIPQPLRHPYNGPTEIYFAQPGDTIDKVARYMFSSGPHRTMAASSKRALLLHNNPFLTNHLPNGRIPANRLVNITPAMLSQVEKEHWRLRRTPLKTVMDQMETETRDMFLQTGGQQAGTISRVVKKLKSMGASVGADDVVRAAGYGTAGVSGYAASGTMAMSHVNALARELYTEAIEKFGAKVVHSKSTSHLAKVQQFLKGHPKYTQLMRQMRELPGHLLPETDFVAINTRAGNAVARQFRRHISLPMKKLSNPTKYVGSVAKQLNGRLRLLKGAGRYATWYIPATLGVISVVTAPPEMRMRTLFEEGFGVFGGAAGTKLGAMAGLGIVAILGLGPFGMFVAVFICASAGGMLGMEVFRKFGGVFYDYGGFQSEGGQIYHSSEELIGAV